MRTRRTRLAALATAATVLASGLVTFGATAPAQASGCRSYPWSAYLTINYSSQSFGIYKTTSQCSDIQLKNTNNTGAAFDACVVFVDVTTKCNYWSTVYAGSWRNIATGVKDGVRFKIVTAAAIAEDGTSTAVGDW